MYQTPTAAMILGTLIFLIGVCGIIALILDLWARIISRVRAHRELNKALKRYIPDLKDQGDQ